MSKECIKHDVCKAMSNFFRSGKLLKQVNSTFLKLIPKVDTPEVFEEFRPISLCNMLVRKSRNFVGIGLGKCLMSWWVPISQLSLKADTEEARGRSCNYHLSLNI